MDRERLLALPQETLVDLLFTMAKNCHTCDGLWFLAVEEQFGMEKAVELDEKVWARSAAIEARRIKRSLGLDAADMQVLAQALRFHSWGFYPGIEVEQVDDHTVVATTADCASHRARARDERPAFPCKGVGTAMYQAVAREVNPNIRMECVFCPPDPHPDDAWCSWRFTLDEA